MSHGQSLHDTNARLHVDSATARGYVPPADDQERAERAARGKAYDAWLSAFYALTQAQQAAWQAMPSAAKEASKRLTPEQLTAVMKRAVAMAA